CLSLLCASAQAQDLAVRAERLHTVAGPVIPDGVVLIRAGKIAAVGPADQVRVPDGVRVWKTKLATPGLIDAHSVIGLAGYLNQPHDQDQLDKNGPIQPELRAIDAYNPREKLVEWVRDFGITTVHTGHGPGALISGQTMIVKTRGQTVEESVLVPYAMLACTLGAESRGSKSPGTAGKQLAMLREALQSAKEYQGKQAETDAAKRPARDLRKEAWVEVLSRKVPLLVTAHRHQDLISALRLAKEFEIKVVLDGASEVYQILDEVHASGVFVIAHPPMARFAGEMENASRSTPLRLLEAGIPFAFQSGHEDYVPKTRVVLYEAAIAAAHGLGAERALQAITLDAARLLGLEARIGSLEVGKDGDLAIYDGDPFEYTTHCLGTVIDGKVVFEGRR
ncbi:MAG: amidohydrolase family protein, partial [Planctomycetia bacterium]